MKKYLYCLFILTLLVGCNKNITRLDIIIREKRIQTLVNEYVDNVINKNDNNNIYITGVTGKNPDIIEISLYNQQPVLYIDKDADYLNSYIKSKRVGIFKYKGVNFYVTDDLKDIFELEYKSFDRVKNNFDKQAIPKPVDYYSMFININRKDSSIVYYSNLSKESLKWREIK